MRKFRFIIIIVLLLELVILTNFNTNTNIKGAIINPKMSNLDTGFQNPTIVENIYNNRGIDFYSLASVKIQNDNYAFALIPSLKNTKWIRCTGFGFDLPNDSVIEGIEVQIDDFDGWTNEILAQDIYLVLNDVKIGVDKESGTPIGTTDTDIYRVYGSSTDMWNTELNQIDIESSTFGVQIFYHNPSGFIENPVNIDNIQINVYYSTDELPDDEAPTWDNLIESSDPLELGNTEIININVYDESTISFVYIEINNVNYTMDFISGDNYRYSNWTPTTIGVKNYSIYMSDEFNNINWTGIYNITVIEPSDNDFIIILGLIGMFSIIILILTFSILFIKKRD